MTTKEENTLIRCPTCNKPIEWSKENLSRPFCSERCKIIDLGAWAEEEYKIPEIETDKGD